MLGHVLQVASIRSPECLRIFQSPGHYRTSEQHESGKATTKPEARTSPLNRDYATMQTFPPNPRTSTAVPRTRKHPNTVKTPRDHISALALSRFDPGSRERSAQGGPARGRDRLRRHHGRCIADCERLDWPQDSPQHTSLQLPGLKITRLPAKACARPLLRASGRGLPLGRAARPSGVVWEPLGRRLLVRPPRLPGGRRRDD